jgi:transaldolase/glucose-6-phosphate isomerase
MKNPVQSLHDRGQSVWLDDLRRRLIVSGELKRLIEEDGLRGLTSNPAIFARAIVGSDDYADLLTATESRTLDAKALYERIAVRDVQDAADLFLPVYEESGRRDGFVSLEVSPRLAHEMQGTLEEARRLWHRVARENLMIKVPGTQAGIAAVRQLIGEGINVNVTLLFEQETYIQVANAYFDGLERRRAQGGDLGQVASVASFLISRIDTAVDRQLEARIKTTVDPREQTTLRSLKRKVAIASAKCTYQKYLEMAGSDRWQELRRHGAQPQRLLWASTGTQNAADRDVRYVEELIGPDTVNTIPPATLAAFRDHGRVRATLTEHVEEAVDIMELVERLGVSFKEIADRLLSDGVHQFISAFDQLLHATGRCGPAGCDPTALLEVKLMRELYEGQTHA